jgi:hypothetical protein
MIRVLEALIFFCGFQARDNPKSMNPTTTPAKIITAHLMMSPFFILPNLFQKDYPCSALHYLWFPHFVASQA